MTTNRTQMSTTRTQWANNEVRAMAKIQARLCQIHCLRRSSGSAWISPVCSFPAVSMIGDSP
jgi:hypothetical protein